MKQKIRNTLLLGSGFSKNFGGFLPNEVYLKILNHPELAPMLKSHLLTNRFREHYDFEAFYESIAGDKENRFPETDVVLSKKIIVDIYKQMDDIYELNLNRGPAKFSFLSVINFMVDSFSYAAGGSGYIFSLNQDLLVERLCAQYLKKLLYNRPTGWNTNEHQGLLLPLFGPVNSPFYKYHKNDQRGGLPSVQLGEDVSQEAIDKWCKLHSDTYEKENRTEPCLIKLHGSYYWNNDNQEKLWIIGGEKEEKIKSTPLLNLYMNTFSKVLAVEARLFIIGYGFNDIHVNRVIQDSCKKGTKLYIVDVCDFNKWVEMATQKLVGFSTDWLGAYYNSFDDLFPLSALERGDFMFSGRSTESRSRLSQFKNYIW